MRDTELYQQILGLVSPWTVSEVTLDVEAGTVTVRVEHPEGCGWKCPECSHESGCYDHADERRWRHLDTCQLRTFLVARVPRVNCPEHGVRQVNVSWAEPGSRFTMLFERLAIDVLQSCQTVTSAKTILRLSWDQTWNILDRAVARGMERKVPTEISRLGVDEKAFRKGHDYMTIVCDNDRGVVEFVSEGRNTESLRQFYASRTTEQRQAIQAVAMDMHEPYVQATLQELPLGKEKIVFDRFHIMQHMSQAVDKVRRQEHALLSERGDDRLKGTKYLWLKNQQNLSEKKKQELESIFTLNLKTGRAWAIKETLRDLWHHHRVEQAREFFGGWYNWAIRSRLTPVKKVAKMIKSRIENVINYCRHRITNAVSEGLNSKIMAIKRRAAGFRNKENFKRVIYFYCGDLDLYPR